MRAQVIFLLFLSLSASAQDKGCFDFSKKITAPLKKVSNLQDLPFPEVSKKSGQQASNRYWAEARGRVNRSIDSILEEIEAHETTKSKRISSMAIDPIEEPGYLVRQKVHYKVEPFPFVTVEWTEDWGVTALEGGPKSPKSVLISYEKTDGTSHIRHLCGSIVLTQIDPATSDVFIYEEAEATGRSQEDTLNGILGTLKTFRNPQPIK